MEKEQVFYILEIEETKDEDQLRTAYLQHLQHVNPEDDPEGFKRLREAYETAIALARKPEETAEPEKTDIDLWLDKADAIYRDIRKRTQVELWKELFTDPVCSGFDVSLEARERFITYLLDHYYLPRNVWQAIDEEFRILEDIENLKSNFHENFLNYVKFNVHNDGFITYNTFRIISHSDEVGQTDSYIKNYLSIKQQIDNAEYEGVWQDLDDLKAFGLYHPDEDVERLRLFLKEERLAEAEALSGELLDQYPEEIYVLVHAANCKWELDQPEGAFSLWNHLLTILPDNETSKIGFVKYHYRHKEYERAKEYALEVLENQPQNPDALKLLEEINGQLIHEYRDQLSQDQEPDSQNRRELLFKLCWCYFQNGKHSEGIDLLADFTPDREEEYEYHNLFSRILFAHEEYERAMPYLQRWLTLILKTVDDGSEENKKRMKRKPLAYYLIGWCHHEMGQHNQGAAEITQAIQYEMPQQERLSFMLNLIHIYISGKEYEKAIDAADELLKEDPAYYPAYLNRMEAAYEMDNGQLVIDDYYQAIDIYAGFFKPYLFALRVFVDHSQYKDAWGVLEKARENKVEFSDLMFLYEVKIRRNLANSKEDTLEVLELCRKLDERMTKKPTDGGTGKEDGSQPTETDIDDTSEIHFEMGILYWDLDDMSQALTWVRKAQKENPQRDQYDYVEGNILCSDKKYQQALNVYQRIQESHQNYSSYHYYCGLCHEGLEDKEQTVASYRKAFELNEKYRDTADKLSKIYLKNYEKSYLKHDFEQALQYAAKQIEADDCAYYLMERGNVYEADMRLDEAMADYRQAMEYEPDNWRVYYSIGHCYMLTDKFTEAIEQLTVAAHKIEENNIKHYGPYSDLSGCYEALGDYPKAIDYMRKNLKMYDFYPYEERIARYYYYSEQYQQSIDLYRDIAKRKGVSETEYGDHIGLAYFYMGQRKQAILYYRKLIRQKANFRNLTDAGHFFENRIRDFKKAEQYYLKANNAAANTNEQAEIAMHLAKFYYNRHDFGKAKEYGAKAYKAHIAPYGSEEVYVNYMPNRAKHLVTMGRCYLFMGNNEQARRCFDLVEKCHRCDWCRRTGCSDLLVSRGLYFKGLGEWRMALESYQAAHQIPPTAQDDDIVAEIEELKHLLESNK